MRRLRPTCARCVYWVSDQSSETSAAGRCHRFPPSVFALPGTGTIVQKFPTTEHGQWCGEWSDDDSRLTAAVHRSLLENARPR
jgi:hypothetical protein